MSSAGPERLGEQFVDDGHPRSRVRCRLVRGERSPTQDRQAERLKIVCPDSVGSWPERFDLLAAIAFDNGHVFGASHSLAAGYGPEGNGGRDAHRLHTGNALQTFVESAVHIFALRVVVTRQAGIDLDEDAVVEAESRIDAGRLERGSYEQTGRDQHHQRQGDLTHDKQVASSERTAAVVTTAVAGLLLDCGHYIGARLLPGRTETERECAEHAEPGGRQ